MARVYEVPTSSISLKGKRLNYQKFISNHSYVECDMALARIVPRIDMSAIISLIEGTEVGSETLKEFLIKILELRKKLMLDVAQINEQ